MLREIAHFVRHVPATLRLKSRLPQAELYHVLMERADQAGFAAQRRALVEGLTGDALEVGAGTGLMFRHYPAGLRVTATEPDASFAAIAGRATAGTRAQITLEIGDVERLPFPEARFDAVVVSLVLCSVPSIPRALAEIRRVLKPGGELRLIEHVRSEQALPGLLMRAFNRPWLMLNQQGCNMHRHPLADIRAAGFEIQSDTPFQVFTQGIPAFPMRRLHARRS
jgi:SAM-dependent methyltransferase